MGAMVQPGDPFNYHFLEPGDSIVFSTSYPMGEGMLGLVTHVADTGIDAFILNPVRPFHATALTHETDPRLQDPSHRPALLSRGIFRLTGATTLLRTLPVKVAMAMGATAKFRKELQRLAKLIEAPFVDGKTEDAPETEEAEAPA